MEFRARAREWGLGGRRRALAPLLLLLATVVAVTFVPQAAAANGAVTWGSNLFRQLGDGSSEAFSDTPVGVREVSGVTAASAGGRHSLALLSGGTVMAWGDDEFGQLGNGSSETVSSLPVAVKGLSGVSAVSAGGDHSLALLSNGTVMAWGDNEQGQLGDGNFNESSVPVAVKGLTGVTAVSAGGEHSLALLKGGTVMAWGSDEFGQLGVEPSEEQEVPLSDVPVSVKGLSGVSAISAGDEDSLALLSGGTAMAWGADQVGQLGDGATAVLQATPVAVSDLSGVKAISAGKRHGAALLSNGTVMDWGAGEDGILGDGSSGEASDVPVAVSGLTGVVGVSAGGMHTVAFGAPIPTVTHVTPESGPAAGGTTVTIGGLELAGATAVKFGTASASSFTVSSPTSITAVTPPGTGTVYVTVSTASGTSAINRSVHFTYLPAPAVKKISPNSGSAAGGASVTITGTGFSGASAVMFGSAPASSFTVSSSTSITAVAPAQSAGTVDVTVSTPSGTSATSGVDRYKFVPVVAAVSPDTGSAAGGTSVTVTGAGFAPETGATTFKFGTAKAKSVQCSSTSECTVVAPKHAAGTVDVIATVDKVSSAKSPPGDQFTYG